MLIYNVTLKVDWSIHDGWLQWMRDIHLPEMLGTGCFVRTTLAKLLEIDEEEGPTYCAQFLAASNEDYNRYMEQFVKDMRERSLDKWGNKVFAFRTVMEVVE